MSHLTRRGGSRQVILFHATVRRRLPSIWRWGLSPAFAAAGLPVVWLVSAARRLWAIRHVAERHGVAVADVVVLRVSVPRSLLTRRQRGVWTYPRALRSVVSVRFASSFAA